MADNGQRWFEELDAANVGPYTLLLYETWVGEKKDPATTVEEWASLFNEEDLPDEYSTAKIQSNVPPYVPSEKYAYRGFSGLKGALSNEMLKIVQEGDRDFIRHRDEDSQLQGNAGYSASYRYHTGGLSYDEFLEAIERVAENDEDETAWDTIEAWRSRQLTGEERSSRL